jgi:quercetin dioxygenase-like cupin family protein
MNDLNRHGVCMVPSGTSFAPDQTTDSRWCRPAEVMGDCRVWDIGNDPIYGGECSRSRRIGTPTMPAFPPFMRNQVNKIATSSQHTPGVEGHVFDGADGSQVAFWTVHQDATTAEHVHSFDEWVLVVEGLYVLFLDGEEVHLGAGHEYFIAKGTKIAGRVTAGTRTIHAFAGKRAERGR